MKSNKLGDIIIELRKAKGLTQKELADELGTTDKSVSRWETGNNYPNIDMIYQISKYFKVSFYNLLEARMADENSDDEVVDAIINEFHRVSHRNSRIIKLILTLVGILAVVVTIAILFISSYNKYKVYQVGVDNSDIYDLEGYYMKTKDLLYLGDIKLKSNEINKDDILSIELYYKDDKGNHIIQEYTSLINIVFSNFESYIKIKHLSDYLDNLYIKLKLIDNKNNIIEYESKLIFTLDFTNSKVYNKGKVEEISYLNNNSKSIKDVLLENGFVEEDSSLIKENNKYKILYNQLVNKIVYLENNDKYIYKLKYDLVNKFMEVTIFDNKNIEKENYIYNVNENKVEKCTIGRCNNYKEMYQTLYDKVLYLFT